MLSIVIVIWSLLLLFLTFPFRHCAMILLRRVYDCECADSRCCNMSFSYLVLFLVRSPNGGKYLWYLMNVFYSIRLVVKISLGGREILNNKRRARDFTLPKQTLLPSNKSDKSLRCRKWNHIPAVLCIYSIGNKQKTSRKLVISKCGISPFWGEKHLWNV